jgi:predicted GIY-YIG superfamily endonuclease
MPAVYILRCADGTFYTGLCQDGDLDRRVSEHQNAFRPMAYTATRRPVKYGNRILIA